MVEYHYPDIMIRDFENVTYTRLPDISSNWMARFNRDIIAGLDSHNIAVTVIPSRNEEEGTDGLDKFLHRLHVLEDFSRLDISDGDVILVSCPLRCSLDQLMWVAEAVKHKRPLFACYTSAGTFIEEDWIAVDTPWVHYLEKIWYNKSDIIFVPTEYFKRKMVGNGYDSEKIFVVGSPLDSQEIQNHAQPKDYDLIIFNHRMNIDKNPVYFLRLVKDLSRFFPQAKFRISTSQTELEFWGSIDQNLVSPLNETMARYPSLKIAFNTSRSEYLDLINRAYIAPCFSVHETFGYSVAEALAAGCLPIVPSRLTYPELVKNDGELLYPSTDNPENDYQSALGKIVFWLRHPELGTRKSSDIKEYAKEYDPSYVTEKILFVINAYLQKSHRTLIIS